MMKDRSTLSYLFGSNAPYIEELYEQYLNDVNSVGDYWKSYFDELAKLPGVVEKDRPRLGIEKAVSEMTRHPNVQVTAARPPAMEDMQKQVAVLHLISAYRTLGARKANLDPLKRTGERTVPELDLTTHGLENSDLTKTFSVIPSFSATGRMTLAEIIAKLEKTYCNTIGLEFMHITNTKERNWVRDRFESESSTPRFNQEQKKRILRQITAAETMERYLHTKYVGQKRFSLEGGETFIAALDYLIQNASVQGVEEVIIGMAHRGRLNVLVNVLGKKPADLFAEFEGTQETELPSGDVKYHNGFTADLAAIGGPVHVSLEFNPSHLEIVNPVVEGGVRARQRRRHHMGLDGQDQIMPVLVHGDSAMIGLGVNQANFNLSQTRGYMTGGTIHIVINNQIGFTTSDVRDVRSTLYCTDIAKMIDAPIFHVNADDPEAVCSVVQAALDYAKKHYFDVLMVDTAGRLAIDEEMMNEIKLLHQLLNPVETLFVVDSMLGQDAVNTAKAFNDALPLTGVVLTKMDGDARGGAALSVRHVTGKPIKFVGVGEKITGLEPFHPDRLAGRILGMGDVLSLIEDVQKGIDEKNAAAMVKKLHKGKKFDLNDFLAQIQQMRKMGGLESLMSKLPGELGQLSQQIPEGTAEKAMARTEAIIFSMTPVERANPQIIKASRKRRIALGSGTSVQEVNRMLNQFEQSQKIMKKFAGGGMGKLLKMAQGMKGVLPR